MELGFDYTTTKDGSVRVTREGRLVSVIGGKQAAKLRERLERSRRRVRAPGAPGEGTGNYKSGNKASGRG